MGSDTTAMEPPAVSTDDPSDALSQALESLRSMPQSSSLFHDAANLLSGFQPQDWAALIQSSKPPPAAPHTSVPATAMPMKSKTQQLSRKAAISGRQSRRYNPVGELRGYSASGPSSTTKHSPPPAKRQKRDVQQLDENFDLEGVFNAESEWRRNSVDTRSSQCCSSCSEGVPCVEPDCEFQKEALVACIQTECKQPLCLDECLSGAFEGEPALYQGNIPSSARLSDWDYSAWNPQLQRSPPQIPSDLFKGMNRMGHIGHTENLQTSLAPRSGLPTPPSMVNNMDTPFSPSTSLATPQSTHSSHIEQPNVSGSMLSGPGMMFNAIGAQWNQQTFGDGSMGNGSSMFNCAWTGCAQPFASQQEWTEHIHHAHVDPQMTFNCPMPTENCPPNISHHPIHHLEADHGFNFLIDNQYSCPAPNCDPDQTFLNPKMLHNHFDQAHSTPVTGSLFCKWNSCDTAFSNPHELFSHLNEYHQLSSLLSTDVHGELLDADTKYPAVIPDAELSEDDSRNRCMWKTGHGGVCGTVCETESDLQTHVKEAHLKSLNNRVGYNCQWQGCSRPAKLGNKSGFTARGKLERHMASHTGYKMATCDICGAVFSAPQSMKQHRRLHTGEKPWKCKHCGKQFPQQSACTIHERTHTFEKPLLCSYPGCGARFSDSSNLAKHRKTHGEEGAHVCKFPGCNKTFHRLDQLKKHRAAHTSDISAQSSELVKIEREGSDESSNLFEGYNQLQPLKVNGEGNG